MIKFWTLWMEPVSALAFLPSKRRTWESCVDCGQIKGLSGVFSAKKTTRTVIRELIFTMPLAQIGDMLDASDRHGVQLFFSILVHPFPRDLWSVTDDRSRLEVKFLLAELEDLSDLFWVQERFSTADVGLHTGFTKEVQTDPTCFY